MAVYDEEIEIDFCLDDKILQLAELYGLDRFHQALSRQEWIPKEDKNENTTEHVLLSTAIEHYFSSDAYNGLAQSSKEAYRGEMNLFVEYCKKFKDLNPDLKDVSSAQFLSEYLKTVNKQTTKSKKAAILRSFLKEAYEFFYHAKIDKLKRILRVKIDKKRLPRAFTREQIEELMMLVRLGREAHRNFTILWTFLGTGIRLNELCNLQVGDINAKDQEVYVLAKGDKEHKAVRKITKFSLELLCQYVKFKYDTIRNEPDYNERYIFSDDKGVKPLHDSTIQKMLSNLIQEAKTIVNDEKQKYMLSVHSLRHSFALHLLESGVDIYTIQELLDHKWLTSTLVYLQLFDSMLVKAINKHPLGNLKVSDFF